MKRIAIVGLALVVCSVVLWADDHGNTALTATPVETDGTLMTACIDPAGDMDYFLFRAAAGRTYSLVTSHPSEDMDSVLYLFATDGLQILSVDDNSAGETASRIVWTCPAAGTYFLMVRHAQATLGTGCYGVSISVSQLDDHGDNALSATPIPEGGMMSGYLEDLEDIDAFLIEVERGYEYEVVFSAASDQAELVATLTSEGGALAMSPIRSTGSDVVETFTARESETLFMAIESVSTEVQGGYSLAIRRLGYGDDHANSAAAATQLSNAQIEIQGQIEVASDVDWFAFDARDEAEYTFVLRPDAATGGLRLGLRGADGQLLREAASTVAGESIRLEWLAPESGTYFLEVSSTNGAGGYTLIPSTTLQLQSVGQYNPSGYSIDVVAQQGLIYLVVGTRGLLILDVETPSDPFEIGSHSTRGYAQAVALSSHHALVANRTDGVTVLDVSDPTRPTELSVLDTPGSAWSIVVDGNRALIADQRGGLHIATLRTSGELVLEGSVDTRGYAYAVAASGNYAYVAVGDAGFEIIDISEITTPVSVGWISLPGDASDVTLAGTTAYIAAGYRGVRIVDIATPEEPMEIGWLGTGDEVVGVAVAGNMLYVAERTAGLSVYSLSNPESPQLVAQIDTPGEATAVSIANGFAYVADRQEGVQIVQLLP